MIIFSSAETICQQTDINYLRVSSISNPLEVVVNEDARYMIDDTGLIPELTNGTWALIEKTSWSR